MDPRRIYKNARPNSTGMVQSNFDNTQSPEEWLRAGLQHPSWTQGKQDDAQPIYRDQPQPAIQLPIKVAACNSQSQQTYNNSLEP
jgi:hypothetical protein